ncbi:hypothetical protein Aduo_010512 [Ancylostoma duodenale]
MVTTRRRTMRFAIRPPLPLTRAGYCPAHRWSSERPQASPVRWSRSAFVKKFSSRPPYPLLYLSGLFIAH